MLIILDTNIFFDDYALKGTSLRILFEYLKKSGFHMIIPEVVFLEIVNQVREKITAASEANNKRIRELEVKTGLTISSITYQPDIDKEVDKYENFLRARLKTVGAKIEDIPSISHKSIVERDLKRKKPFTKSGKGYRDALIWETILQIASKEKDNIIFISENSGDFSDDDKKKLHPDLYLDLLNRSLDHTKVRLVLSLQTFVRDTFIPKLPSPEQALATFMEKNHPSFNLESSLAEIFSEELQGREVANYIVGRDDVFESNTFSMVEYAYDIEIIDEHEISSNERVIELEAYLDCEFDAFIFKSDLYCMNVNDWPHVWDHDWNDHYAAVSFSETVLVQAYITLNMEDVEISSVEVIDIKSTRSEI